MLKTLETTQADTILFGGAFSGGKSVGALSIIVLYALRYPQTRYAVLRKKLTYLRQSSLLTLLDIFRRADLVEGEHYILDRSHLKVTFNNGSEIFFKQTDAHEDPGRNSLKMELTAWVIEEADEVDYEAFSILQGRRGRRNYMGKVKAFGILTCNPSNTWIKNEFYDPYVGHTLRPEYAFIKSLPEDNPYNSQQYLDQLDRLPESERQRYKYGRWEFSADPNQLITYEMLLPNLVEFMPETVIGDLHLGIDVARSGADNTVYTLIDDEKVISQHIFNGNDTKETALRAKGIIDEKFLLHPNVKIDTVGVGAGTFDNLRSWGYNITGFNSAESPSKRRDDSFEFYNKRAEAYWDLRQRFIDNKLLILKNDLPLIQELVQSHYEIRGKKILIEAKDEIKKRLSRSPDRADSLVMANYKATMNNFYVATAT